jgi:hypothetical protein
LVAAADAGAAQILGKVAGREDFRNPTGLAVMALGALQASRGAWFPAFADAPRLFSSWQRAGSFESGPGPGNEVVGFVKPPL